MTIKPEMLRVFRAVAEQGTLAQAGKALGRTPSALSMTLSQLEAEIDAPLFEGDRKNRLTPLGVMVLEESARATEAFDNAAAAIRRHARSTAGTVRIAAVPTATLTLLPPAIAAFRRGHRDVRLEIADADSATVLRRLHLDEADIGIISEGAGGAVAGTEVMRDQLGIVCRPGGAISLAAGAGGGWELLGSEPLIDNPLCDLVNDPYVARLRAGAVLQARNTTTLLSFVRAGLGATILPSSVVATDPAGLRYVAPAGPAFHRRLMLLDNPTRRLSPAAQAFRAILADLPC